MRKIIKLSFWLVALAVAGTGAYVGFYFLYPDIGALAKKNPEKTAFMEYREAEWEKGKKKIKIRQRWVPLSAISPFLRKAVVIAEDGRFWSHEGFDFEAIRDALEKDIKAGKPKFGASTISQQLAKNLYLSPSKNPVRKLKEAVLTYRIEKTLSKKRILEIYLNVVEWGDGVFGAETAARRYFGKSAAALSPDEAARLAVVLPNPRKWSPVKGRYVERRARTILAIMERQGMLEGYLD
ncbi:MAG: monofunctional biosynthetic peptidoglycan transglycosylase [Nitrospinae bacterium]|nr:monofunctional biosynthetic peptidoglycan transglycosylase [Nitrospinota bacterium]